MAVQFQAPRAYNASAKALYLRLTGLIEKIGSDLAQQCQRKGFVFATADSIV